MRRTRLSELVQAKRARVVVEVPLKAERGRTNRAQKGHPMKFGPPVCVLFDLDTMNTDECMVDLWARLNGQGPQDREF